jgi:hypothetical protein
MAPRAQSIHTNSGSQDPRSPEKSDAEANAVR